MKPLRLLLVEDSPTDAKLVVRELQRRGRPVEFERVETAETMRAALARETWDLVLSDWSMPTFSAGGALAVLKESGLDLPFIIVSGTVGEDTAVEAMQTGAHDYVLKDKLGRLLPAVDRELRECQERSARRQAEAALRESEARFRRLAESGIIGIVTSDMAGNILDANDTYLNMIGHSREDLVNGLVRWTDLTPPDLAQLAARAMDQLEASGVARPWETESFRKDGSRFPVLVGVAKLDQGRAIAFIADLTERKEAEAGRRRAEEALRRSEEQLRQAQKMEAVGRLAGSVAHDFNNVLSVILSYGELILGDMKPADPLRADVGEICAAASRAAGLTRQLLTFSRQQMVEQKVLDLRDVLAGMEKMLTRLVGADIELVLVGPKSASPVRADPGHIEQVILNLVVNARDAMPSGGKLTIEITNEILDWHFASSHPPIQAGPHVMLAVTDTGTGMDPETQSRIFEPFFTTKEPGKGTGLGLATVFGVVRQSSGSISVYSEPGRGTTFKIYLPRVDAELDTVRPQVPPSTLRGTETILLVEDEAQVRIVISNTLQRQGYRVLVAEDAAEALELSERHVGAIDLLLTDVVIPHMSGPDLARSITAMRPEMKIICMSGYTGNSIVRQGFLDPGMAFLQKPVTPASLTLKVREVLDSDPRGEGDQPA